MISIDLYDQSHGELLKILGISCSGGNPHKTCRVWYAITILHETQNHEEWGATATLSLLSVTGLGILAEHRRMAKEAQPCLWQAIVPRFCAVDKGWDDAAS